MRFKRLIVRGGAFGASMLLGCVSAAAAAELPTPVPLPDPQKALFGLAVDCSKELHAAANPIQAKRINEECEQAERVFGTDLPNFDKWRAYVYEMEELDGGGVRGLRVTFAVPYHYTAPGMLNSRTTGTYPLPMYLTNGYLPKDRITEDDPMYAVIAGLAIGQRVEVSGDLIQASVGENWKYPTSIKVTVNFKSINPY
jgi:hypothetical protein